MVWFRQQTWPVFWTLAPEFGLSGRRSVSWPSPLLGLRNVPFRGCADHISSERFAAAVDDLVDHASAVPTAVLCSVWWRCRRRRLEAHMVLIEHIEVFHLFHDRWSTPHQVTAEARRERAHVAYAAPTSRRGPDAIPVDVRDRRRS